MDAKFVYHNIVTSQLQEEEGNNGDFLIEELPFSRLKDTQADTIIKEEIHVIYPSSPSKSEQAPKNNPVNEHLLEQSFSASLTRFNKNEPPYQFNGNISKPATPPRSYTRTTSQARKDRTPRTMLKLMERHRENERVRHHTLNESLRVICHLIPGCSDDGRETKVVMMQRIISYIAYLENSISSLCNELGMYFNSAGTPLVNRLKKKVETKSKMGKKRDEQLNDFRYTHSHQYGTRRLKLSSPTVDSTTDTVPIWTSCSDFVNSQDSTVPSSTYVTLSSSKKKSSTWPGESDSEEDIISNTGDYDPFFDSEIQISTSDDFGFQNDYLISPDRTVYTTSSIPDFSDVMPEQVCISSEENQCCDITIKQEAPGYEYHPSYDSIVPHSVTSDQIVATNLVHTETSRPSPLSAFKRYVTFSPGEYKTIFPASSGRNPLHNLTNWPYDIEIVQNNMASEIPQINQKAVNGFEKENDGFSGTHGGSMTRKQKAHALVLDRNSIKKHIMPANASDEYDMNAKRAKVDLRKTSWMNGFMMYSRLNRRRFIEANPGVLTSSISKMMGQAWRNMSDTEQTPYKEKAKQFSQEMQREQNNLKVEKTENSTEIKYSVHEPVSVEALASLIKVKQEKEFVF